MQDTIYVYIYVKHEKDAMDNSDVKEIVFTR